MKRKYRLFKRKGTSSAALLSLLLAFLLLAGCSPSVPAPSQSPEPFSESHPAASLSYLQVEAEQVLTAESAAMVIYPEEGTVIREIPEGTLLTVLAAAASENQEWLLIRMRDLRSPSNLIGWVKKGKTLAYDESLKEQLVSPILIPGGTTVYPNSNDGKILRDNAETQGADTYGSVLRREDGYLLLVLTSGTEVWAAEDAVQAGNP
jgi:hypothetical protein